MSKKKHIFVIACNFDGSNRAIYDCVASIRKFHPKSDILIVDSNSANKKYFELRNLPRVEIADIANKNYDSGAYWFAYHNKKQYNYYYFIHDSVIFKKNVEFTMKDSFTSVRYFISKKEIGGFKFVKGRLDSIKYILSKFVKFLNITDIDGFGYDNFKQIQWSLMSLKKTNYFFPNIWNSVFGPMFFCDREVLTKLKRNNFHKILPSNKNEQMSMERLWGIALTQEGYNVANTLQGDHFKISLNTASLTKKILNRK
jgi:hypothetical protein